MVCVNPNGFGGLKVVAAPTFKLLAILPLEGVVPTVIRYPVAPGEADQEISLLISTLVALARGSDKVVQVGVEQDPVLQVALVYRLRITLPGCDPNPRLKLMPTELIR